MTDARPLRLIPRFAMRLEFFALNRCYRSLGRHVQPHRGCTHVWPRWLG